MSYDSWKTTEPTEKSADYAQAIMDDLDTDQVLKRAFDLGILKDKRVFEVIEQTLYDYYLEEYYHGQNEGI